MVRIETSFDQKNNLTIHKVEGQITAKEIKEKIETYYAGESITKNTLWDFTQADISNICANEYLGLVNMTKVFAHLRKEGKTALVISDNVDYGIGRMYETLSEMEELSYEIRIFRGTKKAENWLYS